MDFSDIESTLSYKCPGCGSNITYSPEYKSLVCYSCGNAYEAKTLNSIGSFAIPDTGKKLTVGATFVCDSCGAAVATDENTAATTCAFCGSSALIKSRLTDIYRPDSIIPFKVSREEAEKKFEEFVKNAKRLPRDYKNAKLKEKLTGLYVPFWLMDGKIHLEVEASGYKYRTDANSTLRDTYAVTRILNFNLERVPFDGAKKISDKLMEAIEPFDMSEMIPFDARLLQGFFAQKYDMSPLDLNERIQKRFYKYAEDEIDPLIGGYDEYSVLSHEENVTDYKVNYCLLPVWFLNYEYKGINYQFAINGQTGEVAGRLPEKSTVFTRASDSISRFFGDVTRHRSDATNTMSIRDRTFGGLVVLFLFMYSVAYLCSSGMDADTKILFMFGSFLVFVFLGYLIYLANKAILAKKRKQKNVFKKDKEEFTPHELDKMPEVFQYYNAKGKPDIQKKDVLVSIMVVRVAQKDGDDGMGGHQVCIPLYTANEEELKKKSENDEEE